MPQEGYETEFHVQVRSQTGVWERAETVTIQSDFRKKIQKHQK